MRGVGTLFCGAFCGIAGLPRAHFPKIRPRSTGSTATPQLFGGRGVLSCPRRTPLFQVQFGKPPVCLAAAGVELRRPLVSLDNCAGIPLSS
jgi:hypothetical protein